jgi:hypothetical protein
MKVTLRKTATRPRQYLSDLPRLAIRAVLMLVGAMVLFLTLLIVLRPDFLQRAVTTVDQRWGYDAHLYDAVLAEKWSIIIGSYMREIVDGVPEIPELVIDVPFKEMSKIYAKREAAIQRGRLIQGPDDFVKAEIRADGKTVPVKMRLKGDWNDHLAGRKWSFRIRVRNGEQLFGLRTFSIQNPRTRGYQAELMYFEALKRYDIMSPRYSFVNVSLNGEPMGIMALEEFFTKELLERNRRREGVIVRFDESLVWDSEDGLLTPGVGWQGAFDFYNNALVDGIGSSRIMESATLSQQYRVAVGLLRGLVNGQLPASEVFDAEQMGHFLAVSDMFGAMHATAWSNLRFYLNPVTLRLEPIGYDATLQKHMDGADSIINDEPLLLKIMEDPAILAVYQDTLVELAAQVESGELITLLREKEAEHLGVLQSEFRLVGNFPLDYLEPRISALLDRFGPDSDNLDEQFFLYWAVEETAYSKLVHVRLLADSDTQRVEIGNAVPKQVVLTGLHWVNQGSGERVDITGAGLPLTLPAKGMGEPPALRLFAVDPMPDGEGWNVEATVRLSNRPWEQKILAHPSYTALEHSPVPVSSLAQQLAEHPFLQLDEISGDLIVPAGRWLLSTPFVTPPGVTLTVESGATLQFGEGAVLILHGPLRIQGTAQAPVIFEAAPAGSGRWPGLVVLQAGEPSSIENWIVRDTTGVSMSGWSLTGGVNFYKSDVRITNSTFLDSHGEDALNIIHSDFVIEGTEIRGTASDAFDADFSNGSVTGSRFAEVGKAGGGDAIDVSGSVIDVSDTKFMDVSDKALSVGEKSTMTASNVTIESVGTGAAAKDGSTLKLVNSKIRGATFAGLTAYIKKAEYGPAEIVAENVAIEGSELAVLVQTGSRVSVDGVDAETQDIDVDALYDTVMRKGLR